MADTINDVAATKKQQQPAAPVVDEQGVAEQLVAQARAKGVELVGPDGLLTSLTKRVFETALEEEMSEHLGYDKHDPPGRSLGNSRNGVRTKTVLTEIGPEIDVPSVPPHSVMCADPSARPALSRNWLRTTDLGRWVCALPLPARLVATTSP